MASAVGVALCLATAPAAAQEDLAEKQALRPWTGKCEGAIDAGNPRYPFSVSAVNAAFGVAKKAVHGNLQDVKVMVIDNGFPGYSDHFPQRYFRENHKRLPAWERIEEPPENIGSQDLVEWGHGRHVVGLIMGGAVGAEGNATVRNLLQDEGQSNPWLSIYVIGVGDFRSESKLNLAKLPLLPEMIGEHKLNSAHLLKQDIVNMSIIRHLTDQNSTPQLPELKNDPLYIAAAGNGNEDLREEIWRYPAKTKANDLLVVASHDAKAPLNPNHGAYGGGALSRFSNYGSEFVEIAAPGCQIRSWLRGSGESTPLNGTSFATGVVSFAASLLKALYPELEAVRLKNRLLSSARYSEPLLNCVAGNKVETAQGEKISPDDGCVRYGSELDIETALLARTDVLEYCETLTEESCERRIVYGDLVSIPLTLKACVKRTFAAGDEIVGTSFSRGGALRHTGKRAFQALYPKMVGTIETIEARQCLVDPDEQELFELADARGLDQAGEAPIPNLSIDAKRVIRLVTRSLR